MSISFAGLQIIVPHLISYKVCRVYWTKLLSPILVFQTCTTYYKPSTWSVFSLYLSLVLCLVLVQPVARRPISRLLSMATRIIAHQDRVRHTTVEGETTLLEVGRTLQECLRLIITNWSYLGTGTYSDPVCISLQSIHLSSQFLNSATRLFFHTDHGV